MDPRLRFFYDLVRIVNFFQREQASPMVYILENTHPGEKVTTVVRSAGNLVQAFIGAPVVIDAADLGAATHRVRLFWSNMMQPEFLQAALPKLLIPSISLCSILKAHHIPTRPGHSDRPPFVTHNQLGGARLCMPTVVSYLGSRAFRPKENGNPGEGEVFNTESNLWEELDAEEKEQLMGYTPGDTAAAGVSEADRAIRLGRALEGNTMRRHREPTPPEPEESNLQLGGGALCKQPLRLSTMCLTSGKWSLQNPPFSNRPEFFSNGQPKSW